MAYNRDISTWGYTSTAASTQQQPSNLLRILIVSNRL